MLRDRPATVPAGRPSCDGRRGGYASARSHLELLEVHRESTP